MPLHLPTSPHSLLGRRLSSGRRGFTLIEILVVMGIIILLVLLALPAFRFITGSRSAEAASNQIAAALSVARAQAIGVQETRGVAIYRDPDNDRSIAAVVELRSTPFAVYVAGSLGPPPTEYTYTRGQYVVSAGTVYVCIETYKDKGGATAPSVNTNLWRPMPSMLNFAGGQAGTFVELAANSEYIVLPTGIDARGVSNQFRYPNNSSSPFYRYVSPAVILFDQNGQVASTQYYMSLEGLLGDAVVKSKTLVPAVAAVNTAYGVPTAGQATTVGQVGLVVYDAETLNNAVGTGTPADQGNWLDQNATPLMVNRFNGTLVKGD